MKKSNIVFLLFVVGFTLLLGLGTWSIRYGYNVSVKGLHCQTDTLLSKVIQVDLDKRSKVMNGGFYVGSYSSPVPRDSSVLITENGEIKFKRDTTLSEIQKFEMAYYKILSLENPIKIDSLGLLLGQELLKSGLKGHFELSVVDGMSGDTLKCQHAFINLHASSPYDLTMPTPEGHKVLLHIEYDSLYVFSQIGIRYWLLSGGLFLLGVIGMIGWFKWQLNQEKNLKEKEAQNMNEPVQIFEEPKPELMEKMQEEKVEEERIEKDKIEEEKVEEEAGLPYKDKFVFYPSTRQLISISGKEVLLTKGIQEHAVQLLMEAEEYALIREDFVKKTWRCKKADDVSNGAFFTGISRLNGLLEQFKVRIQVNEDRVFFEDF